MMQVISDHCCWRVWLNRDEALLIKGLSKAVPASSIAAVNEYEAQLLMEMAMKEDQAPAKNATDLVAVDAAFHKAADAGRDALRLYEAANPAVELRRKRDPASLADASAEDSADAAPGPGPASAQQELHGETERKLASARSTLQHALDRDPAQAP